MYTAVGLLYTSLNVQMRWTANGTFERITLKTIGTYQEQAPPMAANQPEERCVQQKCRVRQAYTFAPLIYILHPTPALSIIANST